MGMNKKGQWVFIGIMVFIMVLIVVVQMLPFVKDEIVSFRSPSKMDCDNSTITTGSKATCVLMDMSLFYFAGVALVCAAGYLTAKRIQYKYSPPE